MRADAETSPRRARTRPAAIASWLALAAPFLLFALALPHFSGLPRNDYWGDLMHVAAPDGGLSFDPRVWLVARSNEHWIGALMPLWMANYALTGGDNRGLGAISLVLLVATFAVLYRRLPDEVRRDPKRRALWGLPLAAAVATPAAAHNWELGFSGNQWFLANLLAVLSLARLVGGPRESLRDLAAVAWPLAVAVFTHSTHLSLAAALGAGAVVLPQRRRLRLGLLAAAAAAVAAFGLGYERPPHHPPPNRDPLELVVFTLRYLGGFFSESSTVTLILGLGGVALAALAATLLLRDRARVAERFWLLVAVYGGASALLTAVARGGLGEGLATATSRYASLQALFWIGTVAATALALRPRRLPRSSVIAAVVMVVAGAFANERIGVARLVSRFDRGKWLPPAALALRWGVPDSAVLAHVSPFLPPRAVELLRRAEHVPFDRPAEGPPGAVLPLPAAGGATAGSWTSTRSIGEGMWLRVDGALPEDRPDLDLVLFLDAAGTVRGAAVPLEEPVDDLRLLIAGRPRPRQWFGFLPRAQLAIATPVFATAGGSTVALEVAPEARRPASD